jgi:DNA-binding response OmpR family regulator
MYFVISFPFHVMVITSYSGVAGMLRANNFSTNSQLRDRNTMHVLIAEDVKVVASSLKRSLEEENHSVGVAFDGHDALEMARSLEYDAIVLNVMLPGIDGFEVMRRLRKLGNKTPILALSSRNRVSDIVKGLDIGADDYVTTPYYFEELLARLRSVSRRNSHSLPPILKVRDLALNPAIHEVTRSGIRLRLSPTQYRLLEFLMRRSGQVVPSSTITRFIWSSSDTLDKNTLHTFIRLLRSKVDRGHEVKLIVTARNFGYGIVDPVSR